MGQKPKQLSINLVEKQHDTYIIHCDILTSHFGILEETIVKVYWTSCISSDMSAFFITAFLSDILTPDEMVSLNLDSGILKLYFVVCCNVDLLVVVGMLACFPCVSGQDSTYSAGSKFYIFKTLYFVAHLQGHLRSQIWMNFRKNSKRPLIQDSRSDPRSDFCIVQPGLLFFPLVHF